MPELRLIDETYHSSARLRDGYWEIPIVDAGGNHYATAVALDERKAREIAAHIIRCVNTHEVIVEALRADQMAYADPAVGRRKGYYERAQDLREAALAKLDGE